MDVVSFQMRKMRSVHTQKTDMGKVNQVYFCVLVFVSNVCLVCSQLVSSPCPDIFNYERDESGIYGKIIIRPGTPTSRLVLLVHFTVAAQLFFNYYGTLNQENERFALQNYNNGKPMVFRVTFPITQPLPRVTGITVNGQAICSGQGDTFQPNRYVTTFNLQHTSFFRDGGQVFAPVQTYEPAIHSSYPVYQPNIPAYETTFRPPTPVTQNVYYPNYEKRTQRPTTHRQNTRPQTPNRNTPQYYPPLDEVYQTEKSFTTERQIQRQSPPQSYGECGTRSSNLDRLALVWGGDDYERGDQPWLVAIYKKTGSNLSFRCGGTLISNRHVITAAHCMWLGTDRSAIKDIVVKLGVHKLSEAWEDNMVVTRSLIDAKIHEGYNSNTLKNDILVLVLNKEVMINTYIRPACLWDGSTALDQIVGTSGVVAGWGEQNKQGGGADTPQLVHLPIVRTEKCRSSKETFVNLTSNKTFCAGDQNGKGPCRGDSGGGMYLLDGVKWKLRGIVSVSLRGPDGSCNLNEYIVFTDAAQYLPWIQKVMSKKYYD